MRSSAASLRDDGRLESSCWARGTSSVRIPVGNEGLSTVDFALRLKYQVNCLTFSSSQTAQRIEG